MSVGDGELVGEPVLVLGDGDGDVEAEVDEPVGDGLGDVDVGLPVGLTDAEAPLQLRDACGEPLPA